MASAPEAARLTEAHRLAQARLGATTARQTLATWRILDPTDLDGTVTAWLRVAVPLVRSNRTASANLAAAYYRRFRAIEAPAAPPFTPLPAPALPAEQAITSLTVTGPVRLRSAMARGAALADATQLAQATSARAAMRLALDGGRRTVIDAVAGDQNAIGYARATSGDPCYFCAMLASRGPVYSEESADFEAHDSCACGAEPVYDLDSGWPPGSRDYRDLWDQAARGEQDSINAFRRALEGR